MHGATSILDGLVAFIFGTETTMSQKYCQGSGFGSGRGLGWQRWDPSHSNPTPIPPGPIVQNCPAPELYKMITIKAPELKTET